MTQFYISVILFVLLGMMAGGRVAMLQRRGIKANVFAKTDKSDFLLVPFVLAIVYTVCSGAFGLPLWKPLKAPFWETTTPGVVGIALCVIALVGVVASVISFGNSFRVGIDEENPDKLITTGMFAISRNPIYTCFIVFITGQFLIHRNLIIIVAVICFVLVIHRQILREEKFLQSHYGEDFEAYCLKVRRYI